MENSRLSGLSLHSAFPSWPGKLSVSKTWEESEAADVSYKEPNSKCFGLCGPYGLGCTFFVFCLLVLLFTILYTCKKLKKKM